MSKKKVGSAPDPVKPEPHPDDVAFQRCMAERGVTIRIPNPAPDWELPEPIHVEGELASEALIRLRRATRL
ncbi:hypothetical protein [Longimicrobium terrae]|uniref:Uncharacterized protein n=1 Tax=Longimicrobium terrae TaxID=1639882 RepID=A0A841H742_9BACT|nr:hypothetical protein [Longimicrobium terrae]MBB4638175.1 hypothetical protein [Longimicrobium terrae]MBB6073666.1 hypothetical protein [Longimicrobium terrae]NNC30344.1 hypothetical protein [Longimicrobium terrae]